MPSWFGGFINPALAIGAALASVPLLIHLLNRQRHRPVRWAAMRFVLAAYRKTRRRVQMENLLLLLLRMAVIVLLALAIARPFTGRASPLAALTESRRDLVLVMDVSASTGYREDVDTVFERIVGRARTILGELEAGRGDRVRLVASSSWPRLLSWTTPDQALSVLDTLTEPTDEPLDLARTLDEVRVWAEEDAAGTGQSSLEVRVLSDLQRRSFTRPLGATVPGDGRGAGTGDDAANDDDAPVLHDQLEALSELGLRVLVEDLGPAPTVPPNVGVSAVHPLEPVVGPGITTEIAVELVNHGPSERRGVRVVLYVDGERRPNQTVDVPARGRVEVVFPVAFREPGQHVLVAELAGDRLTADDRRAEIVPVPPPVRVLAVDGDWSPRIDEDELGYLSVVLEPMGDDGAGFGVGSPFEPRVVRDDELGTEDVDLAEWDVIWLANVENVPPRVVEELEERVAAGGALVISVGDHVVPESTNARLFRADGSGLLPAELVRRIAVPDRRESYYRVKHFDETHPALAFFAEDRWRALLTEVPVYEFLSTRPLESARVLATLDDEGAHPLLIERAYDRGRVLLWTTTIDTAWTRLPESPRTLVPLVHELLRDAARSAGPPRNVAPGEPLACEVEGFPRTLALVRPDGSRRPLEGEPEEIGGGLWRLPAVSGRDTERSGVYQIEMEAKRPQTIAFAVQIDAREGDLERMLPTELEALHPSLAVVRPGDDDDGGEDVTAPERGELWRWLAALCLAALIGESLWAAWIGRHRGRFAADPRRKSS